MSNWLHPVGPEPPNVYWRRRIVVVVVVLFVLWLFWMLLFSGGSSKPAASEPSSLPTLNSTTAPQVDPATLCSDENIQVSVSADSSTFTAGEPIAFVMKITNAGESVCNRNVGSDANSFTITSGDVDVWSSDDCAEPGEQQIEEIPPGESFAVRGTWDGTVTTAGCGSSASPATAGGYEVVAANDEVLSDPFSFTVS